MTAADKLRELLATRPTGPDTAELVRWWRTSGQLVRELLADIEALDCDLVAARAELERERVQHKVDVEGFESALMQERHEKEILEQVESELRAELAGMRAARDEARSIAIDLLNGTFGGTSASERIRQIREVGAPAATPENGARRG